MSMLPLDDERWRSLVGGYRIPYDASVPLRALEQADDLAPINLWDPSGSHLRFIVLKRRPKT
jgi:hypothetical protein